jgi:excisionase family DNA binding protein
LIAKVLALEVSVADDPTEEARSMDRSESKLLKVAEVAGELAVSQACIRRWILLRRIAFVKVSRAVRIPASEVARIVNEGSVPRQGAR